jgi:hypothetical protein
MVRSIRNLHHQRSLSRAMRQAGLKNESCRGALNGAPHSEPVVVRSAIGVRLSPRSLRQAPRFGRAQAGASLGIRVSRSGLCRRNFERAVLRKVKTLRSCWLGRVRVSGRSISLRRDRSHEPSVRYRLAASHSAVGRVFRTRVASCGSCYFTNPMFAKGTETTFEIFKCQDE